MLSEMSHGFSVICILDIFLFWQNNNYVFLSHINKHNFELTYIYCNLYIYEID